MHISSCMVRYSPEKTQQVWSTHTPGVSHQGSKGESNSTICISVLSPLACFHVLDGRSFELMNMSLKHMPELNVHDEPGEFVKMGRHLKRDTPTHSRHHVPALTRGSAYARDLSLISCSWNATESCYLSQLLGYTFLIKFFLILKRIMAV